MCRCISVEKHLTLLSESTGFLVAGEDILDIFLLVIERYQSQMPVVMTIDLNPIL